MKSNHIYTESELYSRFSAQCALSEQCCADIMKKMQRLEVDMALAERVVERLVKEGFIDESRYAHAFVRDKFRYNHWGRQRLIMELRMKGIAEVHIDDALTEISDDDALESLREIIRKKLPTVKGRNDYEIRAKLIRYAVSKGFEMEKVMAVLKDE